MLFLKFYFNKLVYSRFSSVQLEQEKNHLELVVTCDL